LLTAIVPGDGVNALLSRCGVADCEPLDDSALRVSAVRDDVRVLLTAGGFRLQPEDQGAAVTRCGRLRHPRCEFLDEALAESQLNDRVAN
jgi:hypothetical protein